MGRGYLAAVSATCLLSSSVTAAADEDSAQRLQLAPASAWVMDYAADSCALRRAFGTAEQPVILEFRAFSPGDAFQVTIMGQSLTRLSARPKVRFDPDVDFYEPGGVFSGKVGDMQAVLFTDNLRSGEYRTTEGPAPDWPASAREAREGAVTGLTITRAFSQGVALQTGSLRQPMDAMRTCLDELVSHWGLDPAIMRTLSRKVQPINQNGWASRIQSAYPRDALREGRSGAAVIRLIVGSDGKPTKCIPNPDAPDSDFDKHACDLSMRYARFEPALDAGGNPTASFYTTTIVYSVL